MVALKLSTRSIESGEWPRCIELASALFGLVPQREAVQERYEPRYRNEKLGTGRCDGRVPRGADGTSGVNLRRGLVCEFRRGIDPSRFRRTYNRHDPPRRKKFNQKVGLFASPSDYLPLRRGR